MGGTLVVAGAGAVVASNGPGVAWCARAVHPLAEKTAWITGRGRGRAVLSVRGPEFGDDWVTLDSATVEVDGTVGWRVRFAQHERVVPGQYLHRVEVTIGDETYSAEAAYEVRPFFFGA